MYIVYVYVFVYMITNSRICEIKTIITHLIIIIVAVIVIGAIAVIIIITTTIIVIIRWRSSKGKM